MNFQIEAILPKVERLCADIYENVVPQETCFEFVDGTFRASSRPCRGQGLVYNGWKRQHG